MGEDAAALSPFHSSIFVLTADSVIRFLDFFHLAGSALYRNSEAVTLGCHAQSARTTDLHTGALLNAESGMSTDPAELPAPDSPGFFRHRERRTQPLQRYQGFGLPLVGRTPQDGFVNEGRGERTTVVMATILLALKFIWRLMPSDEAPSSTLNALSILLELGMLVGVVGMVPRILRSLPEGARGAVGSFSSSSPSSRAWEFLASASRAARGWNCRRAPRAHRPLPRDCPSKCMS